MFEATVAHWREETTQQAAEQGYTLSEEYTLRQEPSVWVEDWSDEGPAAVGLEHARLVGLDPDTLRPGPTIVTIEWLIVS
jgi:hypothetical protein